MKTDNDDHVMPFSDRVIERGRGCYNCSGFENDSLSRQHWRTCRVQEEMALAAKRGYQTPLILKPTDAAPDVAATELGKWEKMILAGSIGMCMRGGVQDTFVHHLYFCDKWVGKQGASVATAGKPVDLLPAEAAERVEEKAKKPLK